MGVAIHYGHRRLLFSGIIAFLYIVALFASSPVFGLEADYAPGEVLVRFKPKDNGALRNTEEKTEILSSLGGGTIVKSYKLVPGLCLVKLPQAISVEDAMRVFGASAKIAHVQPNYIYRALSTFPNDPCFPRLYGLHNTGQTGGTPDADIDAPEAWDIANGSEIIVAVLDTGVDYTHPDLAANMWHNPGEIAGNGIDDDGNGKVDDIYGYDFCNNDSNPMDDNYHGTHCAGIVGSLGNNSLGVTGVCWNVKIMSLKFLDSGGSGDTGDAIASIEYAVDMGAKVLSNSWGGYEYDQGLKDAIDAANAAGVLFIAAAGNENQRNDSYPCYPASYDCNNIIAVMATDESDHRWWAVTYVGSNYGATTVDLAAPGADILSTMPTYQTPVMLECGYDTNYDVFSGTSMAAPYVSGACALLWGYKPYLSHLEVKEGILENVDKLAALENDPSRGRLCLTGGRLNLYKPLFYKPHRIRIEKVDDVPDSNWVLPGATITYTIDYQADQHSDSNVVLTDYLPIELDYNSSPGGGVYNAALRTVTCDLGQVLPDENGVFTLSVRVNQLAEPCGVIPNAIRIEGDISRTDANTVTKVGAWNPGVIYVDDSAVNGRRIGMRWEDAYTDFNDALGRARHGCGSQIWVAAGTYIPQSTSRPFSLVSGVPVYGGFAGHETSIDQRDLSNPANETILSGLVNKPYQGERTEYVVSATNTNSATILDGFSVIESQKVGIYISGGAPIIRNCRLHHNRTSNGYGAGILSGNANVRVERCTVSDNNYQGIAISNNSPKTINIFNNIIHDNGNNGVDIWENYYPDASQLNIRNNTIIENAGTGVYVESVVAGSVTNCIVQNNQGGDISNCTVSYSLLTGGGDPCFADIETDNFHLKPESLCIDGGDPAFSDFNEADIDGECRIMFGRNATRVDIGADEFYQPKADYNDDGIVNFIDFAVFASYWQTTDVNISLDADSDVDINDLKLFCDVWLWTAPWMEEYQQMMGMGGESGMMMPIGEELFTTEALESEPLQADVLTIPEPPPTIEEMIDWLDEVYKSGQLDIPEDEYLAFRQQLEEMMK